MPAPVCTLGWAHVHSMRASVERAPPEARQDANSDQNTDRCAHQTQACNPPTGRHTVSRAPGTGRCTLSAGSALSPSDRAAQHSHRAGDRGGGVHHKHTQGRREIPIAWLSQIPIAWLSQMPEPVGIRAMAASVQHHSKVYCCRIRWSNSGQCCAPFSTGTLMIKSHHNPRSHQHPETL